MLAEVDPFDPRLTVREAQAIEKMLEKRRQYENQGRVREAHGIGTGVWILWRTLIDKPEGETGYGAP